MTAAAPRLSDAELAALTRRLAAAFPATPQP